MALRANGVAASRMIVAAYAYQQGPSNAAAGYSGYMIPSQKTLDAVVTNDLPTTDPHVVGALWRTGTVISISAG